jgi:hypothetical protein
MSNSKILVDKIKGLMKEFGFAVEKEIFIDAKLSDGTSVKVEGDALSEGAKVVVITEQGEIPAPDGVHELEDGTKIETKDGAIVRVEEVVAEVDARMKDKPEKMEEVEVPVEVPAEIAPVANEVVDAIVEAIVPLMEEVKVLVEEMKKMKEGMKAIEGDFNSFKKQPAAAPIKNGKTDFNKVSKTEDALDAKVAAILSQRK